MTPTLETLRLTLQPLAINDAVALQRLFPQWEVVRLLANHVPWPYPADGALRFIADNALPASLRGEEWHWTLRLKQQPGQVSGRVSGRALGGMIGAIGVMLGENNRGFWLAPEWQGRGLMTEACDRVTSFWFDDLGMDRLRVPKAVANQASRRISERQGMHVVERCEKDYVSGRLPTEVWEITAAEWRAHRLEQAGRSGFQGLV